MNGAIAVSAKITNSPIINSNRMIGASHHFRCEYMYINSSFIKSISLLYQIITYYQSIQTRV